MAPSGEKTDAGPSAPPVLPYAVPPPGVRRWPPTPADVVRVSVIVLLLFVLPAVAALTAIFGFFLWLGVGAAVVILLIVAGGGVALVIGLLWLGPSRGE